MFQSPNQTTAQGTNKRLLARIGLTASARDCPAEHGREAIAAVSLSSRSVRGSPDGKRGVQSRQR
ncbi:hypothetical protein [Phormidium sp. CCY1219]|uniref:hypothetical protein n=1 Tax=Phormidium sp. CCY1219 TaxID=2886104 RepID=UPI002D78CF04|nr:hypothetical protein [Phormidium sp. CCY1219]